MNSQHLSDEAVAAFADGVLRGHARDRAARHVEGCTECRRAVRSQREAVLALRAAPAPSLPTGLFEKLRALPSTTPVETLPTVVADDGSTMLATFAGLPAAALVPTSPAPRTGHRSRPLITGAAVVALAAGALAGVAVAGTSSAPAGPTTSRVDTRSGGQLGPVFTGVYFTRR